MQLRAGGQRQQCPDRAGEEDEQPGPQQDDAQRRAGRNVPAAGPDRLAGVLAWQRVRRRGAAPPRDDRQDGQERRGVDQENRARAGRREYQPANRRADRASQVLVHRTKRDRLRPFGRRDELGLQRLPGRRGQRLAGPDGEDQRQQQPGRNQAGNRQHAERGRGQQHHRLRDQQETPPVHQVADGPSSHGEQHDGQARGGLNQSDVRRRAGQRQHQPLRGHGLHPAADIADELRTPHRGEQPVTERRPRRPGHRRNAASGGARGPHAHHLQPRANRAATQARGRGRRRSRLPAPARRSSYPPPTARFGHSTQPTDYESSHGTFGAAPGSGATAAPRQPRQDI